MKYGSSIVSYSHARPAVDNRSLATIGSAMPSRLERSLAEACEYIARMVCVCVSGIPTSATGLVIDRDLPDDTSLATSTDAYARVPKRP